MPLKKDKPSAKPVVNASLDLVTDPANALLLVEAFNDIQRSLRNKDYQMVVLSLGMKLRSPQISIKDSEGDWENIPGSTLLTAMINYGKAITNADLED